MRGFVVVMGIWFSFLSGRWMWFPPLGAKPVDVVLALDLVPRQRAGSERESR